MNYPKFFNVRSPHGFYYEPVEPAVYGYRTLSDPDEWAGPLTAIIYEGKKWTQFADFFSRAGCISQDVAQVFQQKTSGFRLNPISFAEIKPKVLSRHSAPNYHWFEFPQRIETEEIVQLSEGGLFSNSTIPPEILYRNIQGQGFVFCDFRFIKLARAYIWKDLFFCPIDVSDNWSVDYLGKQWPPQWWPEGYEPHPSNVIEADIPDIKVGEGLVGEFAPVEAPKPKRKPVRADGPLLSPAAIRGLKLEEGDYGFEGEVPLSRPLYGAETLAVSISIEGTELDEDGPRLKKSLLKSKAQAALARLEPHLPQIHARLLEEGRPYAPTPEAFVETLHDPALLLMAEHFDQGEKWSFVVESDTVGLHFEFDGDTLLDVWSGD